MNVVRFLPVFLSLFDASARWPRGQRGMDLLRHTTFSSKTGFKDCVTDMLGRLFICTYADVCMSKTKARRICAMAWG